jgi:hypothetical protein
MKATSLEFLQAVYCNEELPLTTRMRAAIAALNYEVSRLQVTAQISENDIATVLDRRIARLKEMRLREANGSKLIDKAEPDKVTEPEPIEVRPPTPTSHRVFSRFNRRF